MTVVPYYRIQNVIDSRTIFQRRWNVATIVADTAGSSSLTGSDAAAVDFDVDEAVELRATLQKRLQSAVSARRDRRTAFEWFEGDVDPIGGAADDTPTGSGSGETPADAAGDDDAVAHGVVEPEVPDDGVVRPDFSGGDRDYSEPAERIDTGEYAVDTFPSDTDVRHRGTEAPDADSSDDDASMDGSEADDSSHSDDFDDSNHSDDVDDSDDDPTGGSDNGDTDAPGSER